MHCLANSANKRVNGDRIITATAANHDVPRVEKQQSSFVYSRDELLDSFLQLGEDDMDVGKEDDAEETDMLFTNIDLALIEYEVTTDDDEDNDLEFDFDSSQIHLVHTQPVHLINATHLSQTASTPPPKEVTNGISSISPPLERPNLRPTPPLDSTVTTAKDSRASSFSSVFSSTREIHTRLKQQEDWDMDVQNISCLDNVNAMTKRYMDEVEPVLVAQVSYPTFVCPVTDCPNTIMCSIHSMWEKKLFHLEDSSNEIPRNPPMPLDELMNQFKECTEGDAFNSKSLFTRSIGPVLDLKAHIAAKEAYQNYTTNKKITTCTANNLNDDLFYQVTQKLSRYCGYFIADSKEQEYFDKIRFQEITYRFSKTAFHDK